MQSEPKEKWLRWTLWGLLALIVVGIVLLIAVEKPREVVEEMAEKVVAVRTVRIAPRSISDVVVVPGRVVAAIEADLGAENAGRIVELLAEEGDRVAKDQVLLRIDDRLWRTALARAEIEKREADKDATRWAELEKTGAVSTRDLDSVRTRCDLAEAARVEARVHVDKCEVRSPIRGLVEQRRVEQGEFVNEGQMVFKVVDIDRVKVAFDMAERDVLSVRVGASVGVRLGALPDCVFTGTVSFVSSLGGRSSNAFRTEARLENPGHELRPGMIAEVEVVRGSRDDVIVFPLATVVPQKGEHVVFVVADGRAERRVVRIDSISGRDVVLASGVNLGDEVVLEGQRTLVDGALVSPVDDLLEEPGG